MGRKRRTIPWIGVRGEIYYVFWTDDETGKTKRLSLGTTESLEAQQRYAAFLAKGHEIFNPKPGGLTVSQALDQYQSEHVETSVVSQSRALAAIAHLKARSSNIHRCLKSTYQRAGATPTHDFRGR
jgi:hypothetical protein